MNTLFATYFRNTQEIIHISGRIGDFLMVPNCILNIDVTYKKQNDHSFNTQALIAPCFQFPKIRTIIVPHDWHD